MIHLDKLVALPIDGGLDIPPAHRAQTEPERFTRHLVAVEHGISVLQCRSRKQHGLVARFRNEFPISTLTSRTRDGVWIDTEFPRLAPVLLPQNSSVDLDLFLASLVRN